MPLEPTRRAVVGAASALVPFPHGSSFEPLERRLGGRLGVYAVDLQSGRTLSHRAAERFPMCSTFKALLAAQVLALADRGALRLDERIAFNAADLIENSPVSKAHVSEGGLTVAAMCEAIVTVSDNTAANLLLRRTGGPAALTAWLRRIGDDTTRLDRVEPGLNQAEPGDPRDSTTPEAVIATWRKLLFGPVLTPGSRAQLLAWLEANTTGDTRLRKGLPTAWRVGDKTGANSATTTNDIAVAFPPGRRPVLVAAMITQSRLSFEARDPFLAEVGRIIGREFSHG